ncbi:MAG: hypothetical protein FK732_06145 [Asgard group archaeon]|nr:hypothetical protein [Asgard group archaeon]
MSEEKDIEEIKEETEEPETTLTTEEEEETFEEPIEAEETKDEPLEIEEETEEPIEAEVEEEAEEVEDSEEPQEDEEEIKVEEEDEVEEIDAEVDEEVVEVDEELEIPEIPLEVGAEEEPIEDDDFYALPEEEEEVVVEEEVEAEEVKPTKPKKKKKKRKKRSKSMLTGLIVGILAALIIEVAFSVPLWMNGVSRPDLYYIELVLILVAMTLPGLFSRNFLEGILGGFIIFVVAFVPPLVLSLSGLNYILNPLTPLFSSVDYSIPAFDAFKSLMPGLETLNLDTVQFWIWIVDLVLMFILAVIVVTIATALIRSITIKKKKVGHWIGIPLLSLGLIVFVIFTPIVFSSTFGIIQASTSFLGGTAKMDEAYVVIDNEGLSTQSLEDFSGLMAEANQWLADSQLNFRGLRNIGLLNIMTLVPNQYGSLIQAGDQLALATLAITDIIVPLFNGIFDLVSNINNATKSMADFGPSPSLMFSDIGDFDMRVNDLADLPELKQKIVASINGLDEAELALIEVQTDLEAGDFDEVFDEINATLETVDLSKLPEFLRGPIGEIISEIGSLGNEITGFTELLEYTSSTIGPTKSILWTAYNSLEGNEYLKYYKFTDAKKSFQQAVNNVTSIVLDEYTPTPELVGLFSSDITGDYSLLLHDLITLMDPLLNEELYYAMTLEGIGTIITEFHSEADLTAVDFSLLYDPAQNASTTATYGVLAEAELTVFRANIAADAYGNIFGDAGVDLEDVLTRDFKPLEFGQITNQTADAINQFISGCEKYKNQNFIEAIADLVAAEGTINNAISTILAVDDPQYLHDYLNNWSLAITSIRGIMQSNDSVPLHAAGLAFIKTECDLLYDATDELA